MTEVTRKLQRLRTWMKQNEISGIRFKGVDWFSWITGGASSVVIFTSETGIAEVFITSKNAWILTNKIEGNRLIAEETPSEFEVLAFPWQETNAAEEFTRAQCQNGLCLSDRPSSSEEMIPFALHLLKMQLLPEEILRYRQVGRKAAEAMTEALSAARPEWSEDRLAGEGAKCLWSRGLDPTLIMVGGEDRAPLYRHPIATAAPLGRFAMMVFCARAFGLYANLTRFIFFDPPSEKEKERFQIVARIEADIFSASRPNEALPSLYLKMAESYKHWGFADEINRHHQGGPTGYLSREHIVTANSPPELRISENMALAWNPSLPGVKIEDTILVTNSGLEILTVDPDWPTIELGGYRRPDVWVKQ